MPDNFSYGSYDSGMVSNGDSSYSDSYYDSPINFTSPEFYSADVNATTVGSTAANQTPVSDGKLPASVSSFIGGTLNKLVDTTLAVAKGRFGNSAYPTGAQGGKVQDYTGNPNPAPGNLLNRVYESTAQPNQGLPAAFAGQSGLWIGLAILAAILLFMGRK